MNRVLFAILGTVLVAAALAAPALADVRISSFPYERHDLGTDATILSCSSIVTDPAEDEFPSAPEDEGAARRQQNEPSAAVDPSNPLHQVAGSNEYCPVQSSGTGWVGFYYSNDGGASWTNSLVPGYPLDDSFEGMQSPLQGLTSDAGDPVQAWDRWGHLYYGGIAFNRDKPTNGSIFAARYNWPAAAARPDYEFTSLVSRGTPTKFGVGHFEDKVQLEVDRGVESPYSGNGSNRSAHVYMCWARFTGSASNNFVEFARSTDGGVTWRTQKISEGVHGSQFCDIAVTKNGTVFVVWRQFAFKKKQRDGVAWVKSTNGGASFTKPAIATEFTPWDLGDHYANPAAAGRAKYESCLRRDGTLGGCSGPEPRTDARDCGDGPFTCQSGYVFFRADSQTRVTADPTAAGDPDAAYVVFEASVPGSETSTGTSYGTLGEGVGTQASVYFIKTENGGANWTGGTGAPGATRVDTQPKGHQFFPDIDANAGRLHVVYHDSRFDCATGPVGTAMDFRTVPISHRWLPANPPGAESCGPGLDTFYASSTTGGSSWAPERASTVSQMPQKEQFGDRDIPFHGDYNYISAAGNTVLMAWTDQRDATPGPDPRYTNGDGTDGFDVHQCRDFDAETETWSADNCPNAGGLDQNIYGYVKVFP